MASPVYHYDVTVTNNGTTNIGTFWFSWIPGEDFLPSAPLSASNPAGWGNAPIGGGLYDGSSIQWVASSNAITPGHSLSGFAFTSADSPAVLAGTSPFYPSSDVLTSFVYSGAPEVGVGDNFTVAAAVTTADSTTTVFPSAATIDHGDNVTFTATVAPAGGSGTDPTGTVTFFENGNSIGSGPLQSGIATLMTTALPSGSLSITAQYGGDSTYSASTSSPITETVNPPLATMTTLMTSNPSVTSGTSVTFTATVAPVASSVLAPTGTVTFSQNGNSLGTFPVQPDGTAQLVTSTLAVGADPITAAYSGDTAFAASTSAVTTETVSTGSAATTTALMTSAPSINSGDSVTLTATVSPAAAGATPTGTVSFSQDGNALGSAPVASDGTAVLTTSTLPVGSDTVTATYSGDGTYAGSTSPSVDETVSTPATVVPMLAKSTLPAALVGGSAAHGAVTIDLTNSTDGVLKGKVTVELFASTDGSIDGSAVQLAHVIRPLNLKASHTGAMPLPIRIAPGALAAGSYTLLARVIDPSGNSSDSSTGKSLTVAAPFIALSESFTKMTIPSIVTAGAKAHAIAVLRISNNGNITTPGTTTVALFATSSGVVDGAAVKITSVTRPLRIRAGKSVLVTIPVRLIPTAAAGAYTIVAQVTDSNGQMTVATSGTVNITT